jgi:hypothetical protein
MVLRQAWNVDLHTSEQQASWLTGAHALMHVAGYGLRLHLSPCSFQQPAVRAKQYLQDSTANKQHVGK